MKVTLILPIYNVEKYLDVCLNSIISQKYFEDCEVLLINDGSTDCSVKLCNQYAEKYSNIIALHKTNGGLSDARNYGLERANGKYVLFIDSDDYIFDGTIEMFINEISNHEVDIVTGDASVVNEDGELFVDSRFNYVHKGLSEEKIYSGQEAIKEQLLHGGMQTTVWLGMYKRDFLIKNKLWFKQGLLHEDELWTPQAFILATSVKYIENRFYAYRIRNNSIMRNNKRDNTKNIKSLIYIYEYLNKMYDHIDNASLKDLIKDDWAKRYLHAIVMWKFSDYPELLCNVNKNDILKNSKKLKNKVRAIIFMINPSFYCNLLNKIKEWLM
ncbi:glycosyltransferase [Clostridium botulinum]|uniref:glycosyltransferase n=1 Tax=Clostridium botulinum TaxID=1491 RepID=UPI0013C7E8F6|nr:glycosyltransferase [Clostridium botulinum]MBN1043579.1 glycosyltransferase [Clostridium botulinum]NFN18756.1 glycosyltransferase [Clostridium botulinum]NFN48701.1 glycosyltransferase [Clostridium botulinum]